MHNGAKYTPEALERVITGLKDKGYELVPISQPNDPCPCGSGKKYKRCCGRD